MGLCLRQHRKSRHTKPSWNLMILSTLLIMADPSRHVLQDIGVWTGEMGSSQYGSGCHDETFYCLSFVGWLFTVFFTYSGFILLLAVTFWSADVISKYRA